MFVYLYQARPLQTRTDMPDKTNSPDKCTRYAMMILYITAKNMLLDLCVNVGGSTILNKCFFFVNSDCENV
jgi:hypothetical protein